MGFTGEGFFSFNDINHVKGHIRYLLRTEKDQRRTNGHTKENLMFLMDDMDAESYSTFPEGLEERREFEKMYFQFLEDVPYQRLAMGRFEWKDPDVYTFTDEMVHKVFEMAREIEARVGSIVLAVGHLDQPENYVHVHFFVLAYDDDEKEETT